MINFLLSFIELVLKSLIGAYQRLSLPVNVVFESENGSLPLILCLFIEGILVEWDNTVKVLFILEGDVIL